MKFSLCSLPLLVVIASSSALYKRQLPPLSGLPGSATPAPPSSSAPLSSSIPSTPSSSPPSVSSPVSSPPAQPSSSPPAAPSSPPPAQPSSDQPQSTPDSDSSTAPTQTSTVVQVITNSASSSSESSTATAPADNSAPKSTPIGTGTIVGLSVAGGVAVLGIVAFIVWKLTRKRFSDFDNNGEEIKWPELNNETHALPTNPTGRVGIEDDGYDDATVGYPRGPSPYGAAASSAGISMADVNHSSNDPYAVPPLPHLNPNQPYRDDPNAVSGYYDPYRGPVPQSLHDPANSIDGTESIPMSTYTTSSGSGVNNGQGPSYYSGAQSPDQGRRSPGPAMSYGRQSPGPAMAYGRQSPGPAMAYNGRQSPGPAVGYGGRHSPGPGVAYGESGYTH